MAKADSVTKDYMKQSTIFADAFNFYLYDGRQVIKPEQLTALDPTEIGIIDHSVGEQGAIRLKPCCPLFTDATNEKEKKETAVQKYRDILKQATVMTDNTAAYLILGIENQNTVHYAMPVRAALYDCLQYNGQVEEIAKEHRDKEEWKGKTKDEYVSGFYKTDSLIPVITLVIYFKPGEWDGPRTLHEMFSDVPEGLEKYVPDYRLNMITPKELEEEDFSKFHTNLGKVLKFIQCSEEKVRIRKLVAEDSQYQNLDRESARVISACTDIRIPEERDSEVVNVCKAVQDMIDDAVAEKEREMQQLQKLQRSAIDLIMRQMNCSEEEARKLIEQNIQA